MSSDTQPVPLAANQPRQFYRGGAAIAALRNDTGADGGPEDWVASTTTQFGKDEAGLSRLPDGRWLRDAVAADPVTWLGAEHAAEFGGDTALLVKLLDAGQRLPVHCHPSNAFAEQHFGCRHGKTEAWIVVGTTGPDPTVYIGFREDVPADVVARWVAEQDPAMLDALNPVAVSPGDTVFVPAGVPHAIGEGVFIVELQQPTDFSITLEWDGFLADAEAGHLGLGYDKALDCVERRAQSVDDLVLRTRAETGPSVPLLGTRADPFFRADRLHVSGTAALEPSFGVLVVLEGAGTVGPVAVHRGSTLVVPHAAGEVVVTGDVVAVRCRPPLVSNLGS
ncbi:mannose-6-phosphate isomerase [Saccharothrix longispora]|uniref:class I mannose-6-phosphate isomerase n=1 Tax=Saccharothrix longispora TaxID=33920 RepID=UPI0028FD12DD|nr:mannose-6-phosphate isomerase [Saccharothrix longispora]MBY8851224.1 mannose-6-phosphate isomerase [Saccharothrix sp. MB29]MDU0289699.1 mannose-6-phosphate isomerase [Saccharothrix longispora]